MGICRSEDLFQFVFCLRRCLDWTFGYYIFLTMADKKIKRKLLNRKIVCLGGGIGTVNLIRGLKRYTDLLTIVVSMADEGGSSGRLRRLYNISPPGDIVSCMAAMLNKTNLNLPRLLTYRFPGDRYGQDDSLGGHKLGNLMMVALRDLTGSFDEAILLFKQIFNIPGEFLPATTTNVSISAKTIEGKKIFGEEKIDLGKYNGKRVLERIFLHPKNAPSPSKVGQSLENADCIIAGPGDLYTTILPVFIVPKVSEMLKKAKTTKIFIVNIANKPFETKDYTVLDYIKAIKKHLGSFPFNKVIVNSNTSVRIPKKYHYDYVRLDRIKEKLLGIEVIEKDLVDEHFPLYHNSSKLAEAVRNAL